MTSSTADRPSGILLHAATQSASPTSGTSGLFRVAVGIVGGFAVACGGTLPHPPYIAQPQTALVLVSSVPPPARVEYVPRRPAQAGAVWVDGEWTLRRGRWAWRVGRWVALPSGTRFSPWAFVRAEDGSLFMAPGVFRDVAGKVVDEPAPLAVGQADAAADIDPDGQTAVTGRTLRAPDAPAAPAK